MKVTTLRIPESLYETLQEEADEEEMSLSEYVRRILRNRKEHTDEYKGEYAPIEQVEKLEARVARLEDAHETGESTPPSGLTAKAEEPPAKTKDTHTKGETAETGDRGADSWHELLEDVYSRENSEARRRQLIAAGGAAIEAVRTADEPLKTGELVALYDEYPVEGQAAPGGAERPSKETYWRKTVKPALDAAEDAGLLRQRSGKWDWVWIGESDDSGVYDPTMEFSS